VLCQGSGDGVDGNGAYQDHLKTAHFKKYKEGTADMVKTLKLIDTNPMVTATLNKSALR